MGMYADLLVFFLFDVNVCEGGVFCPGCMGISTITKTLVSRRHLRRMS